MEVLFTLLALLALDAGYHIWLKFHPEHKIGNAFFAKMTPGAIVSEVRGKIAATVYSKNKGGAVIRNRITPINRRSTDQTTARQLLASFASQWRGLTPAQRASWNAASPNFPQQDNLGQTIFLSGEQLFIRSNANRQLLGLGVITSAPAPTSFDVLSLTTLTIDASAGTVSLAFAPTVPAGFSMVVRATAPVSQGKDFFTQSAFRFIKAIAAAETSPQALGTEYVAKFGSIAGAEDQKVALEAFLVENASGLSGIPVRITSIIVP